jgi:excisionase family DNA binding protein
MTDQLDLYAVLGLSPGASQRAIRAAFRTLARRYHPDVNHADPAAERTFKRIARAYEVLRDPVRRARYDRRRQAGRFGLPGQGGVTSFPVDGHLYHSDLGHHSDFYGPSDPVAVSEAAALLGCHPSTIRRRIRRGELAATFDGRRYWLRRRDVERFSLARQGGTASRGGPDRPVASDARPSS